MKKFIIPIIALCFIIIFTCIILSINTTKEITSEYEIKTIKQDSNLDILVNLGDFSKDNYSERKLLDVAMLYAENLDLVNETNNESIYLQYVSKDDVHNLIYELTGITIEAPIEIDDFYYLYDSENSYYYFLGASPTYYKVSNIKNIKRNGNTFDINCSIEKIVDGELIIEDNVSIILNYISENSIIKYRVEEIKIN